jgi:glycerate-2-kinase
VLTLLISDVPGDDPINIASGPTVGDPTTVTLRGQGRGGRNGECLLSMGLTLDGHPRIHALAGMPFGEAGSSNLLRIAQV